MHLQTSNINAGLMLCTLLFYHKSHENATAKSGARQKIMPSGSSVTGRQAAFSPWKKVKGTKTWNYYTKSQPPMGANRPSLSRYFSCGVSVSKNKKDQFESINKKAACLSKDTGSQLTDKRHLSGGKGGKKMKKIPKTEYTTKQMTGQAKSGSTSPNSKCLSRIYFAFKVSLGPLPSTLYNAPVCQKKTCFFKKYLENQISLHFNPVL